MFIAIIVNFTLLLLFSLLLYEYHHCKISILFIENTIGKGMISITNIEKGGISPIILPFFIGTVQ